MNVERGHLVGDRAPTLHFIKHLNKKPRDVHYYFNIGIAY